MFHWTFSEVEWHVLWPAVACCCLTTAPPAVWHRRCHLHHALQTRGFLESCTSCILVLGVDELFHDAARRRESAAVRLEPNHELENPTPATARGNVGTRRSAKKEPVEEREEPCTWLTFPGKGEWPVAGSGTSPSLCPSACRSGPSWLYSVLAVMLVPSFRTSRVIAPISFEAQRGRGSSGSERGDAAPSCREAAAGQQRGSSEAAAQAAAQATCLARRGMHMELRSKLRSRETPSTAAIVLKTRPFVSWRQRAEAGGRRRRMRAQPNQGIASSAPERRRFGFVSR